MQLIKSLKWRYATKKFDPGRKVSAEHLEMLKEAIRLSVSSYGLQLYKVLIIEDRGLRGELLPFSQGQDKVIDASHLFVFCNYVKVEVAHIDEYLGLAAKQRHLQPDRLKGYGSLMKEKISEKSPAEQANWTARQVYIALGNLLAACAELRIDACPMEGFEAAGYNRVLGLSEQNLSATVLAAVGYRSGEDKTQFLQKVRMPLSALFKTI